MLILGAAIGYLCGGFTGAAVGVIVTFVALVGLAALSDE